MDSLRITVIGGDLFDIVQEKLESVGLNTVNQLNYGMLGNLKTLTYTFDLKEDEIIEKRKKLMMAMSDDNMRLMPLYVHGDWMKLFVMKPIRI